MAKKEKVKTTTVSFSGEGDHDATVANLEAAGFQVTVWKKKTATGPRKSKVDTAVESA